MNAILNIQVRVAARQANQALQQVQQQVNNVNKSGSGVFNNAMFAKALNPAKLISFGKNLQWTGRQLEYSFTLPILAASAAATKFALDNDRALTGLRKVYGNGTESAEQLRAELAALDKSFIILSNKFGIHLDKVGEIAASWAQAGAAGRGLAESVLTTMQAMILGEMDAAKATEGLIGIQAAYNLNSQELRDTLYDLNVIENQTGITLSGLIDVLARAGGTAKTAGIEIGELAALASALVPAAGSAAQAGNALRTIISRIMSPTREAADLMKMFGIDVLSASWQSQDAMGRLRKLAEAFVELDDAQKTVVSSAIASRWQLNRFDILAEELTSQTGFFARALQTVDGRVDTTVQSLDELSKFLGSDARQFDILTNAIRNQMTQAIQPLLPSILGLLQHVVGMATAFNNLNPEMKQFIVFAFGLLAVVGPITRVIGAFSMLLGIVFDVMKVFKPLVGLVIGGIEAIGGAVAAFVASGITVLGLPLWAFVAIVAAVLGAAALLLQRFYSGGIRGFINDVANAFRQLPRIIGSVIQAVVRVIQRGMEIAWEWLGYLNPFRRRSPSLVDNVSAGVSVILGQYARLRAIPAVLASAMRALREFNAATAAGSARLQATEQAELRADIVSVSPDAGPAVDRLFASLNALRPALVAIGDEIASQELVVDQWKLSLDAANRVLEDEERILESLQRTAASNKEAMDSAKALLDTLVDTPIEGMKVYTDAIFENEMAQKALRLEMLRMEAAGQSFEDIKQKAADLQGQIEMLRGDAADLRAAGAGSDVLGPLEDQIRQMEQAQAQLLAQGNPIADLQNQLQELQRQGEILDLEQALRFDPLKKQIEEVTNSLQEMPFDELFAKIVAQQAVVEQLTAVWKTSEDAVTAQQAAVDQAQAHRDAMQAGYERERLKLEQLRNAYSEVEDQIRAMEQAQNDLASSARKQRDDELSMLEELFLAGEGFNFDDVGGISGIGREGGLFDIEQFNRDMEKQFEEMTKGFGKIDFFKPIKDSFKNAWDWVKRNAKSIIIGALVVVGLVILEAVAFIPALIIEVVALGLYLMFGPGVFKAIADGFMSIMGSVWEFLKMIWAPLAMVFTEIFSGIGTALSFVWTEVIKPVFDAFGAAAGWLWREILQPVFGAIGTFISSYVVPVFQLLAAVVEIVVVLVGRAVTWVWKEVIEPVFSALDWLFRNVVIPVFQLFWAVLQVIFAVIDWTLRNVVGPAFSWLWENVIKPVLDFIGEGVGFMWNNVLQPIFSALVSFIRNEVGPVFSWLWRDVIEPVMGGIGSIISNIWNGITETIKDAANFFIRVFNTIAKGVKAVASFLDIKVTINEMPEIGAPKAPSGGGGGIGKKMHSGGIVDGPFGGPGLRYDEVVRTLQRGEGVIPADVVRRLGRDRFEKLRRGEETGGVDVGKWFSDRRENVENIAGAVRKGAVMAVAQPFLKAADAAISLIPNEVFRGAAKRIKNDVYDWVKGIDERGHDAGNAPIPGSGWGAIVNWLNSQPKHPDFRVTSTYRPGDTGYHGANRAVDFSGPTPSRDSQQLLNIYKALLPAAETLVELIYYGPGGGGWKNGSTFSYSQAVRDDHHDHVHAALYNGGIARGSMHGSLVRVGERFRSEAIVPLSSSNSDIGKREVHINGNLSFPNIRSGDDADKLIRNLESLADV